MFHARAVSNVMIINQHSSLLVSIHCAIDVNKASENFNVAQFLLLNCLHVQYISPFPSTKEFHAKSVPKIYCFKPPNPRCSWRTTSTRRSGWSRKSARLSWPNGSRSRQRWDRSTSSRRKGGSTKWPKSIHPNGRERPSWRSIKKLSKNRCALR